MSPGDLLPGPRVLLGPGPAMADPRVLRAMSTPLLGQFDPEFTHIMNEVMELTRFAFQTTNARTFPVPGTGRAGLEAALVSLIEPGDRVVVAEFGRFGLLLIEIAERCGADVVAVRSEWGRLIDPNAVEGALGDGVRLTRSTPRRARRGSRGALRATSPPRRRAARRARRLGVDALRQGAPRAPAPFPDARRRAGGRRRAARAPPARGGFRHRDRRGVRPATGKGLAHRHHGLLGPAPVRAPLPHRARGRTPPRRLPRPRRRRPRRGPGPLRLCRRHRIPRQHRQPRP